MQRNGGPIRGTSSDSVHDHKAGVLSSTGQPSWLFLNRRTAPQGVSNRTVMSGPWDQEVGNNSNSTKDHGSLSEARREAFSENKRNRSSSRSSKGRVEKKIEATLPKVEQPPNARSRKSSHMLGLFKENTASQEIKKGHDKPRPESSAVGDLGSAVQKDDNVIPSGREDSALPSIQKVHDRGKPANVQAFNSEEHDLDNERGPLQNSAICHNTQTLLIGSETSKYLGYTPSQSQSGKENLVPSTGNTRDDRSVPTADESDSAVTKRLHEEIGNYPNPTALFHHEFAAHGETSHISLSSVNKTILSQRPCSAADGLDDNKETNSADRDGEAEEDEDSDKEQISSALYYPHQAPSPDSLEDLNINVASQLEGSKNTDSPLLSTQFFDEQGNETHSEDVDIALQSQNKSRYLHGDLQKTWVPPVETTETAAESGTSSASDSEYESSDENVLFEVGEESSHTDEFEITPTATPIVKDSFLASRGHKPRRPRTSPFGAVELKPYNHQVGGHTKVFQFSRQAVCKQLSNRENVFYEVVEREHPDLLRFLPRYVIQSR